MSTPLTRRDWLAAVGAAGLLGTSLGRAARAADGSTKKVLFFTKSSGFQHSVITRKGDELGHAEKILVEIGKAAGFDVVPSKDGRLFDPDKIGQWDAFVFCTTGDLTKEGTDKQPPMSPEGEEAFYKAIRSGKGFMGMHCATDTFGHHRGQETGDPFIELIGGEFQSHGAQHEAKLDIVDPAFPGVEPFGKSFKITDEWYAQKNLADDLHVIIAHDTSTMKGWEYERPNFPQTWARNEGKGKVFYTSMGHREDVWDDKRYQGLLVGALKWITGQAEFDAAPNVSKVTPGYQTLGKRF
jgi:type 1 glutamine amidotransferase